MADTTTTERWLDRRALIEVHIQDWEAVLMTQPAPRDMINATSKLHAAQLQLLAVDIAEELEHTPTAEGRAALAMLVATADGSHVAAGQASKRLEELRAVRIAAEEDERRARLLATSPTEALTHLAIQLLQAPPGDRQWLADVLTTGKLPD